jgi:hypothetical protein
VLCRRAIELEFSALNVTAFRRIRVFVGLKFGFTLTKPVTAEPL